MDEDAIRTRRRANYEALRDELAELTLEPFRKLPAGTCPLYFPVLAEDRSGAIAKPGNSGGSLIVQRITGPAATRMPLGGATSRR